jgi:hypothetical protein
MGKTKDIGVKQSLPDKQPMFAPNADGLDQVKYPFDRMNPYRENVKLSKIMH